MGSFTWCTLRATENALLKFSEAPVDIHVPTQTVPTLYMLSTQIWPFFLIVPWINIHVNRLFWVENHFCVEHTM